jgi:hypothetical protein
MGAVALQPKMAEGATLFRPTLANGAFQTNLFYICLFGTGWNRFGLYGPIILHASIPLGGIIFLSKRKQIEVKNALNII